MADADDPRYEPEPWNGHVRAAHNCYDYARGVIDGEQDKKTQPGTAAGLAAPTKADYNCTEVERRVRLDMPQTTRAPSATDACPAGTHMIALAVDPGRDYHFYRRDRPVHLGASCPVTLWSHKPGSNEARNHDDSMRLITDPRTADRHTEHFNYRDFCGYFCIPTAGPEKTDGS